MNYSPKTLLEQQCMTFCAVMKAMEGHLTEHNILSTCDKVWNWTKAILAAELTATNGYLEPPPELHDVPPPEASPSAPPPAPITKPTGLITKPQQKRLYAIARDAGMSEQELKEVLDQHYGISSVATIHWKQYAEICTAVETGEYPE